MFFLFFILTLFLASPFLLVGLALKSLIWAAVGLLLGVIYSVLFWINGFQEFSEELRARASDQGIELRLQKLWGNHGIERVKARFWTFPDPEPHYLIWVAGAKNIELFMSQGFLNIATDAMLTEAFRSMSQLPFSDLRLQNRRHALSSRVLQFKGAPTTFRYWWVSFWFYPLEWLLKIAKL